MKKQLIEIHHTTKFLLEKNRLNFDVRNFYKTWEWGRREKSKIRRSRVWRRMENNNLDIFIGNECAASPAINTN